MTVKTYEEWAEIAKFLDNLEENDIWKNNKISRLYDYEKVELRYLNMKQLRQSKNITGLVSCLRQDLMKNYGDIANPELYNHSHFGTKRLIEKYHNEIIKCIRFVFYYTG